MKTTFLNNNSEGNLKSIGFEYMKSRIEDFEGFILHGYSSDDLTERNYNSEEDYKAAEQFFYYTGDIFNYGLSFSNGFNEETKEPYYRYQLSWGGPSDEIRFYQDGRIEYVYLDWFCGVGFDVTKEDWAEWLYNFFDGCDSFHWEQLAESYQDEIYS